MQKWEYCALYRSNKKKHQLILYQLSQKILQDVHDFDLVLAQLGLDSWELVTVRDADPQLDIGEMWYFKRPLQ